jgi:hypothetical protein
MLSKIIRFFKKENPVVYTIKRKNVSVNVIKMKVKDLDQSKCSFKFLSHNFPSNMLVNIKCDPKGNIEFRTKRKDKQEYRIIVEDGI